MNSFEAQVEKAFTNLDNLSTLCNEFKSELLLIRTKQDEMKCVIQELSGLTADHSVQLLKIETLSQVRDRTRNWIYKFALPIAGGIIIFVETMLKYKHLIEHVSK